MNFLFFHEVLLQKQSSSFYWFSVLLEMDNHGIYILFLCVVSYV